jgi:hypothetical protein
VLAGATAPPCRAYDARPIETGHAPSVVPELSGLAASLLHPGIYWAHNDSGHAPEIYAIRENGTLVARFAIHNAVTVDPEDIGVGPCTRHDARTCIYLADTGDNLRSRSSVQVVRVVEPATLRSGPLIAETVVFAYPDGAHDAEALLVDPRTAQAYVITKSLVSLGDVYRIDVRSGSHRGTAVRIASLAVPEGFDALVTAASVHPSGTRVLLRTYRGAWELRRPEARSLLDVLAATPTAVPTADQRQGEAITYTADGTGYLLGGEGDGSPLVRIRCQPSAD